MSTLKVKGHTHLVRDLKSQAIINTDSDAYARYMARKVKQQKKDDEVRKVIRDVNEIKKEMFEIKDLLKKVIDGRSSLLGASGFIASSTDVIEAILAINTEVPEVKTDLFTFPGRTMVFEGATDDAFETTISFAEPTADRTHTLPNASGTIIFADTTDTLTNKTIALGSNTVSGTLAQFNSALTDDSFASLTGSETLTNKTFTGASLSTHTFSSGTSTSGMTIGANGITFEGATADAHETTLTVVDPTQDNTITIPDATMTAITTATHATQASHIVRCIALG